MNNRTKEIENFPNYKVCSNGYIYNIKTGRQMTATKEGDGQVRVELCNETGPHRLSVKRIVMDAFNESPMRRQIVHKDGDILNNNYENLRYAEENESRAHRRARPHQSNAVMVEETGDIFPSQKACADYIGGTRQGVSSCVTGKIKTHRGYHIKYYHS